LRAEPEGGTILVRVRPGRSVSVIDHGPGITPSDRESIFEPFWRKRNSAPGSGLGLSIVKEIVGLHGGKIIVTETPGGGATIELSFPLVAGV